MSQEFTVGVFARLSESWSPEESKCVENITYHVKDWCDDAGVEYYKKEGHVLVERHTFTSSALFTREQVVQGMIAGLRTKKAEIQAEAHAACVDIESKINKLLALEYTPAQAPQGEFAPRKGADDVTDVEPGSYDVDIPF